MGTVLADRRAEQTDELVETLHGVDVHVSVARRIDERRAPAPTGVEHVPLDCLVDKLEAAGRSGVLHQQGVAPRHVAEVPHRVIDVRHEHVQRALALHIADGHAHVVSGVGDAMRK